MVGSGCSRAVERTSHNREVTDLDPARCWAFFLLLSSVMCPLKKSLEEVQHFCFSLKNEYLAVQLLGKKSLIYAQNGI